MGVCTRTYYSDETLLKWEKKHAEYYKKQAQKVGEVFGFFGFNYLHRPPCGIQALSWLLRMKIEKGGDNPDLFGRLTDWPDRDVYGGEYRFDSQEKFYDGDHRLVIRKCPICGKESVGSIEGVCETCQSPQTLFRDLVFLKFIKDEAPHLKDDITRTSKDGMSAQLFSDCFSLTGLLTDFRFDRPRPRDKSNQLFMKHETGVVALKYEKGNESEWVPFYEGRLWGELDSWEMVSKRYPQQDGFGSKIILIDEMDRDAFIADRMELCQERHCSMCVRGPLCAAVEGRE